MIILHFSAVSISEKRMRHGLYSIATHAFGNQGALAEASKGLHLNEGNFEAHFEVNCPDTT